MGKLLQWYHKSTRNKVIIFSIIFTFALGYSFLHRPLGFMSLAFSEAEMNLFRAIKRAFDPNNILNIGKMGL